MYFTFLNNYVKFELSGVINRLLSRDKKHGGIRLVKKAIIILGLMLMATPVLAHPGAPAGGGRPPMGGNMGRPPMGTMGGGSHRPPMGVPMGGNMHRPPMGPPPAGIAHHPPMPRPIPYRPFYYSPYIYTSYSYPIRYYSSYTYYPTETYVTETTPTVVVRERSYDGVNTAANIINAAANTATAIRLLTW